MKNVVLAILVMLLVSGTLFAETQGKYQRKSVSSVQSVWVQKGALKGGAKLDYDFFNKMMEFYVEVDRFDYNELSPSITKSFINKANTLTVFNPEAIGKVMEETVVKEIVKILNDPEVMKKRGLALKDEADFEKFAASKAKSFGLTTEEMAKLMNSSYIYLPFITNLERSIAVQEVKVNNKIVKKKIVNIDIKGGIIWYHIRKGKDGSISLKQLVAATTTGMASAQQGLEHSFRFGTQIKKVSADEKAQYHAVLAWAKNLGVKTKQITDFLLSAQIVEADGRSYSFPLGFKEGVHLDDGFDLVEFVEDEDGQPVAEKIGFMRISKTGDNQKNAKAYSQAKQYLGSPTDVGAVVMERPILGIDVNVKPFFAVGMKIPKDATILEGYSKTILAKDTKSAIGIESILSYNLAPIIGISQVFYDLSIGYGMPLSERSDGIDADIFVASAYSGVSKKTWFGRSNLNFGVAIGIDMLSMTGSIESIDLTYDVFAAGVKTEFEYEYMLNPDLCLDFGMGYKFGFVPMKASRTVGSDEYELDITGAQEELRMGGLNFNFGATYALKELPFDLFGWLDPLKKY